MLDGRIACKSTDLVACTLKVALIVFMEEEIRPTLSLERRSQPRTNPLDYCDAKYPTFSDAKERIFGGRGLSEA